MQVLWGGIDAISFASRLVPFVGIGGWERALADLCYCWRCSARIWARGDGVSFIAFAKLGPSIKIVGSKSEAMVDWKRAWSRGFLGALVVLLWWCLRETTDRLIVRSSCVKMEGGRDGGGVEKNPWMPHNHLVILSPRYPTIDGLILRSEVILFLCGLVQSNIFYVHQLSAIVGWGL